MRLKLKLYKLTIQNVHPHIPINKGKKIVTLAERWNSNLATNITVNKFKWLVCEIAFHEFCPSMYG